ncbi:hypothetical protein PPACK8108_LOCUS21062, partial [Phakopsora pachyrhizi]
NMVNNPNDPNQAEQSNNESSLPASPSEMWNTTLTLSQEIIDVVREAVDEDVGLVYEALDQTFKWNERRRERLESSRHEITRLNRQIEANRETLSRLKSNSNPNEYQAEIYSLEQVQLDDARSIKELDNQLSSIKAQITKSQLESQELEKYDPIGSTDFKISSELFKVKLFHQIGFMMLIKETTDLSNSNSATGSEKLLIRCDKDPDLSRVIERPDSDRDRLSLTNQIWELVSFDS